MATRKEVESAVAKLPPESGVQAVSGKTPDDLRPLFTREPAKRDAGRVLLILDYDPEAWSAA